MRDLGQLGDMVRPLTSAWQWKRLPYRGGFVERRVRSLVWRYRWTSEDAYFCPWTPSRTVLRHDAAVNPIVLYVLSLIMTVILLAVVGAGFLGWVFGLLFIPFIVTVIAMTVID
jgi:hypothetical protein